jgi:hypothetical protein
MLHLGSTFEPQVKGKIFGRVLDMVKIFLVAIRKG